jgi:hypothetical protein
MYVETLLHVQTLCKQQKYYPECSAVPLHTTFECVSHDEVCDIKLLDI